MDEILHVRLEGGREAKESCGGTEGERRERMTENAKIGKIWYEHFGK